MKTVALIALVATLLVAPFSSFAAAKTYQVTGPIIELTDKTIVVQKGDEKWEIARDATTQTDGELKVGQKVTIHYRMTATSIDVKPSAAPAKPKAP
jgi:hypothetical protein